jgi:hypothetical protein
MSCEHVAMSWEPMTMPGDTELLSVSRKTFSMIIEIFTISTGTVRMFWEPVNVSLEIVNMS